MTTRSPDSMLWTLPLPCVGAAGAKEGEPVAWFWAHFEHLWRLVARLGVPPHHVDDILQEVFITASRRRSDILEGQEKRFLIGVAIKASSNYRQRAYVRREVSTDLLEEAASSLPDPEQLLIEKRLRHELEQVLGSLTAEHRTVFVLYELEGFNVPEIADLLGLATGTVASRLGRARARFSRAAARLHGVGPEGSEVP